MNLKKINLFTIFIIFIFLLSSCGKDKITIDKNTGKENLVVTEKITKASDYISFVGGDFTTSLSDFGSITSSGKIEELVTSINNDNFQKTQEIIDSILLKFINKENLVNNKIVTKQNLNSNSNNKIVTKQDNKKNTNQTSKIQLSKQDKIKLQTLKYIKVIAILNEGNYFNREIEKSKEASELLNRIIVEYPFSVENFLNNYYLGYSKEIVKDYTGALDSYNIGLGKIVDTKKDNVYKSILINQIGHVYDLKGDKEKAYTYYLVSYNLYNKNYRASLNIARYLTRIGKNELAKKFFAYSLQTTSKLLKSDIYFSLSSIELELNGMKPDIKKSIEFAKKSIENNINNPMGYVALARGYYMLNNPENDKKILDNLEQSLNLNPNVNEAYRYYALYYLDKKNQLKAFEYIDKSKISVYKDTILMEEQRDVFAYLNDLLKIYTSTSISKLDTVYELYNKEELNYLIKTQLKRSNYGIYSSLSGTDNFKKMINSSYADWTTPTNVSEVLLGIGDLVKYRNLHGNTYTTGNSAANLIVNLPTNAVTIASNNGAVSTSLSLSSSDIKNLSTIATNIGLDEIVVDPPSPPQAPVITKKAATLNSCMTYVSSWTTSWSNCSIQGPWDSSGNINCIQTPSFVENTSLCGSHVCTTTYSDGVATSVNCGDCTGCPGNVAKPTSTTEIKTINMNIDSTSNTCKGKYANNLDTCNLKMTVTGNINDNKPIEGWGIEGNISDIVDLSKEPSNRINGGGKALNFSNIVNTGPITGLGDYYISGIKSRSPFSTNVGKIGLKLGNTSLILSKINYLFNKPLIGNLQSSGNDGVTWDNTPTLGAISKYKFSYVNIGNVVITNYLVDNFASKIKPINNYFQIQDKKIDTSTLDNNGTIFSAIINTSEKESTSLQTPGLQIESPVISYNLGGEVVKYLLSKNILPSDVSPIKIFEN